MHTIYNRSNENPASISALMKSVIERFSQAALMQNTDKPFVHEYVVQQAMFSNLHELTTPDTIIHPEKCLPNPMVAGQVIGRPDFYLQGDFNVWILEILVNGVGITDHLKRFESCGKYAVLDWTDFLVVDFLVTESGVPSTLHVSHKNRMNVFFKKGDYSKCTVTREGEGDVEIALRH